MKTKHKVVMRIYALTPDSNYPTGGIRKIYYHIDVLNLNGFSACVVHSKPGFRCTWFENDTRVTYEPLDRPETDDILIIPEIYVPGFADKYRGFSKVFFNQTAYFTFRNFPISQEPEANPYLDPEVVATIVGSEDSKRYLEYVFPEVKIYRIHYGIPDRFSYNRHKAQRISFMSRKNLEDVRQVLNILRSRGALEDFHVLEISGYTEKEVEEALKSSLIFLSFGYPEGFGLPPAEAMACGCTVIGNTGRGGDEYFKEEFSYPIAQEDIIGMVKAVEEVIGIWKNDPDTLLVKGKAASDYIKKNYSMQQEAEDIVRIWKELTGLKRLTSNPPGSGGTSR